MFQKLVLTISLILLSTPSLALSSEEEINKDTVLAFYQQALNNKDFTAARPYLGDYYIQHNPVAKDGIDGLKQFIEFLKAHYPYSHSEIKRVVSERDLVMLHVHSIKEPGTRGEAIIDIFRLEHNKIVEHWDVHQAVPEQSANNNGMF